MSSDEQVHIYSTSVCNKNVPFIGLEIYGIARKQYRRLRQQRIEHVHVDCMSELCAMPCLINQSID